MSSMCNCCNEHVQRLSEQVSVMRKEIKNLRQMLESAIRANRKHMTSLQYTVSKIDQGGIAKCHSSPPLRPHIGGDALGALEQGNILTVPIGHISSCFSVKNGTPRQPTICGPSRATLRIQQSVFNNPEHALVGLEQYSHVWVIFLFHKNGHLSYKAKVKPPRLNGQRVGVYSTRSPHRPNALGLTLAKLETIVGDTIYLSNIDMIAGTPVLDIKPYIPDYDSPHSRVDMETSNTDQPYVSPHSRVDIETSDTGQPEEATVSLDNVATSSNLSKGLRNLSYGISAEQNLERERKGSHCRDDSISSDKSNVHFQTEDDVLHSFAPDCNAPLSSLPKDIQTTLEEIKAFVTRHDDLSQCRVSDSSKPKLPDSVEDSHGPCYGEEAYSTIAAWIREPPVASLDVRFTPHAQKELEEFLPPCPSEPSEGGRPKFRFLCSSEEAAAAIRGVLSADPRSVYRRTRCKDKLFYFTLDTADITCWFGQGFAEVLRVRHIEEHASV